MSRRLVWVLVVGSLVAFAGCADQSTQGERPHAAGHGAGPGSGDDGSASPRTAFDFERADAPVVERSETVRLEPGTTYELTAAVAEGPLANGSAVWFAYNGQVPGPILRVAQGANVTLLFRNDLPVPTTVHWHGVRVAQAMDGVVPTSQNEVPPGGSFRYELRFVDEGVFWYHPHVREDVQQERGLAGVIVVEAPDAAEGPREQVVVLDDVRVEGDDFAPQFREGPDHAAMGRFGNAFLVNGVETWSGEAAGGERVRFVLLNAANVRPFNVSFPGAASVELIGLDSGFLREPTVVTSVVVSPAERAVVDVVMPTNGSVTLRHVWPEGSVDLGEVAVSGTTETTPAPEGPHARARESLARVLAADADDVALTWELDVELTGMAHPMEPESIEWEEGNESMTPMSTDDVRWILRDAETSRENEAIVHTFDEGALVTVRIRNLGDSPHPMQHPIHLHGQRFVVRSVDGVENPWPAWKDTVLVPGGSEAVITVDMSNPGTWLVHCHIPEHMEAGMMASFTVG